MNRKGAFFTDEEMRHSDGFIRLFINFITIRMKKLASILAVLALLPVVAQAQAPQLNSLGDVLTLATNIINQLMPFIVALAVLYFIWGVFQFVMASGDDEARKVGRQKMMWGIIGIFVMVSVWGLVNLLEGSFRTNKRVITPTPNTIPTNPGF